MCCVLIAIGQTTVWGWRDPRTLGVFFIGLLLCGAWIVVEVRSREPLIDMTLMRLRAVWTTNLAAFLLGAGLYSVFIAFPQLAQLPESTGFGFGSSVVASSLYLLPATMGMALVGSQAGRVNRIWGSKAALVAGAGLITIAFAWVAIAHHHPYELLISSTLLGIGNGLAFAALGNLVVQAVPPSQTGVATGMNAVMRTLGGAIGAEISATLIVNNTVGGMPTVSGFAQTFTMSAVFLAVCIAAGLLVPEPLSRPVEER
jgi:MFS family permease